MLREGMELVQYCCFKMMQQAGRWTGMLEDGPLLSTGFKLVQACRFIKLEPGFLENFSKARFDMVTLLRTHATDANLKVLACSARRSWIWKLKTSGQIETILRKKRV